MDWSSSFGPRIFAKNGNSLHATRIKIPSLLIVLYFHPHIMHGCEINPMLLLGCPHGSDGPTRLDRATSVVRLGSLFVHILFRDPCVHTHSLSHSARPPAASLASCPSLPPYLPVPRRPWPPEWRRWRMASGEPARLPSLLDLILAHYDLHTTGDEDDGVAPIR